MNLNKTLQHFALLLLVCSALMHAQVNISHNKHTGAMGFGIPLESISEGNLSVPIGLSYNAAGVKPETHPGFMGMDWALQAGGYISRQVKDKPDDYYQIKETYFLDPFTLGSGNEGTAYYYFPNDGEFENRIEDYGYFYQHDVFLQNELNNFDLFEAVFDNHEIDTEPDRFMLNINGSTSEFYLNKHGEFVVSGSPFTKIEPIFTPILGTLSNANSSNNIGCPTYPIICEEFNKINDSNIFEATLSYEKKLAGFKVTTIDGTIYHFGLQQHEVDGLDEHVFNYSSLPIEQSMNLYDQFYRDIQWDKWYLVKIEDANRDYDIKFKYEVGEPIMHTSKFHYFTEYETSSWDEFLAYFAISSASAIATGLITGDWSGIPLAVANIALDAPELFENNSTDFSDYTGLTGTLTKPVYLQKITTDLLSVDFEYEESTQLEYDYDLIAQNISHLSKTKYGCQYRSPITQNNAGVRILFTENFEWYQSGRKWIHASTYQDSHQALQIMNSPNEDYCWVPFFAYDFSIANHLPSNSVVFDGFQFSSSDNYEELFDNDYYRIKRWDLGQKCNNNNVTNATPNSCQYLAKNKCKRQAELVDFKKLKWMQLNQIKVYENDAPDNDRIYNFSYSQNPDERLRLLSFETTATCTEKSTSYNFQYEGYDNNDINLYNGNNPLQPNYIPYFGKLPAYLTDQIDHWGYFNGNTPPSYCYDPTDTDYPPYDLNCLYNFKHHRNTNASYTFTGVLNTIQLPTGGYYKFLFEPNEYQYILKRNFDATEQILGHTDFAGGLRLKQVNMHDTNNTLASSVSYDYQKGILLKRPHYFATRYPHLTYKKKADNNGLEIDDNGRYRFPRYFSSINTTNRAHDAHVTYSYVTETPAQGGKTEFHYSNYVDTQTAQFENKDAESIFKITTEVFPSSDRSIFRGLLKSKKIYNDQNKLIVTEDYTYSMFLNDQFNHTNAVFKSKVIPDNFIYIEYYPYKTFIHPMQLSAKVVRNYDENGTDYKENVSAYFYNQYNLLQNENLDNSNGDFISISHKYPVDYSIPFVTPQGIDNNFYRALSLMKGKNMLSTPIETYTEVNGEVINASINFYKDYYNGNNPNSSYSKIYLEKNGLLVNQNPLTDYTPLSVNPNNTINYDTRISEDVLLDDYSGGNYHSLSVKDNEAITFVYHNNNVIAKVIGANEGEIFYESFEQFKQPAVYYSFNGNEILLYNERNGTYSKDCDSSDSEAHCGNWYFDFNSIPPDEGQQNVLTVTRLLTANLEGNKIYKWSFWAKGNGTFASVAHVKTPTFAPCSIVSGGQSFSVNSDSKWTLFEVEVGLPSSIPNNCTYLDLNLYLQSGDVLIDDVRFHPKDAFMSTSTFDPLKGVTSETDANNQSTHYKYDGLGHLTKVLDHKCNIIEEYKYSYYNE